MSEETKITKESLEDLYKSIEERKARVQEELKDIKTVDELLKKAHDFDVSEAPEANMDFFIEAERRIEEMNEGEEKTRLQKELSILHGRIYPLEEEI